MSTMVDTDTRDLAGLGYAQQLHRRLGPYASFASGFSFVSILTTIFQLFVFGFSFGGSAFFWTWPVVFAGQLLVALNFSTLAARFPISGAIYQWSTRVSNFTVGWFAGWIMILAEIVTTAVAAIAMQIVVISLLPGGHHLVHTSIHIGSYVLLGAFAFANRRIVGVPLVALGGLLNFIAITANGGVMPASRNAIASLPHVAAKGEFATDEEVRAVWAKHGREGSLHTSGAPAIGRNPRLY